MIIAIDGPAASGKSTSARLLADELDFLYLDTGAMYRCIALSVTEEKVDIYNKLSLESFIGDFNLELHTVDGISDFLINGASVSEKIRTNAVSKKVSEISAIPMIRKYMVKMQREFAKNNNCVVEGRDKRRQLELQNIGDKIALKDLQDDIRARDRYDSERAHSPLKKAFDAIEIDTTEITIDEQVRYMIKNVKLNNK